MAQLDFRVLHRKGSKSWGVVTESYSVDFIIDGKSLLEAILENFDGGDDYLGCFARDWDLLNAHSERQLFKLDAAETKCGRSLIYVCPECADIGCGALGCKIAKENGKYIWSDFAFENGYEEPTPIPEIGPFEFNESEYEEIINKAIAL